MHRNLGNNINLAHFLKNRKILPSIFFCYIQKMKYTSSYILIVTTHMWTCLQKPKSMDLAYIN